jgi:outer membrane protein assembly factor BamE (lipoprotein component of BamABCDE complex)
MVKKRLWIVGMILVSSYLFTSSTLAFASEEDTAKIQGIVMALDINKNTMIVNEKLFVWNQNTAVYNDKGSPMTIDKFKPQTWVYIEGERDKNNRRIIINKIYLLPKYVDKKERHLYPFME